MRLATSWYTHELGPIKEIRTNDHVLPIAHLSDSPFDELAERVDLIVVSARIAWVDECRPVWRSKVDRRDARQRAEEKAFHSSNAAALTFQASSQLSTALVVGFWEARSMSLRYVRRIPAR